MSKSQKKLQARKNFNVLIVDEVIEIAGYITSELGEWYHFDSAVMEKMLLKNC